MELCMVRSQQCHDAPEKTDTVKYSYRLYSACSGHAYSGLQRTRG